MKEYLSELVGNRAERNHQAQNGVYCEAWTGHSVARNRMALELHRAVARHDRRCSAARSAFRRLVTVTPAARLASAAASAVAAAED